MFQKSFFICYPANTSADPEATAVHPDIPSPTLPMPLKFTNTVELPVVIAAACAGQGLPGRRWTVLRSPCRLTGMLLTKTLPEPWALTIGEQWGISASPILVTAGMILFI